MLQRSCTKEAEVNPVDRDVAADMDRALPDCRTPPRRRGAVRRRKASVKRPLFLAMSMMVFLSGFGSIAMIVLLGQGGTISEALPSTIEGASSALTQVSDIAIDPVLGLGAMLVASFVVISVLFAVMLHLRRCMSAVELELDLILNYSSLRVVFKDDRNNVLRLNRTAAKLFGMTPEQATGRSIYELNPSHAKTHHMQDLEVIQSGQPSLGVVKQVWIAGKEAKWNRVDKIPYKDPQSGDDRILMIATDLTEQIRTEQALRHSEERYHLAVELSAIGTWERDFVSGEAYWSPRIREMLGITDPAFVSSSDEFERRLHPDDHDLVIDALQSHVDRREPYLCEFRLRHEDGHYVWVRSRGQAIWDGDGKPLRMAGSVEDITANIELERQLVQAQKMEAVGQLTGGLAHDFNNLLAIILGNLQLLERVLPDDEKMKARVEAAISASEKGAELTRRLLAFARRQQLEAEACDVNKLVADLTSLLGRTLGETIEIQTNLSGEIGRALIDPSQFEAAILNLAVNARDAMPQGGRLLISTEAVHVEEMIDPQSAYYSLAGDEKIKSGEYVVVSVSDSGTGIAREDLERIFDPFFTTKEVGKGSGLGLSMVYGFMKQSGGHVGVYSEEGKGTTVRMYVPVDTSASGESDPLNGLREPEPGGGETILLAEDNEGVRKIVTEFLEALGYRVAVAEDGPSALSVLARRPDIDLLFTDIVMPGGMLGTQLAARAREVRPNLPVVFTTGFAAPEVLREGNVDSSQWLVSKPFRKAELARTVRAALNAAAPSRMPRAAGAAGG
jgi:PAS domain S-box-containing protein